MIRTAVVLREEISPWIKKGITSIRRLKVLSVVVVVIPPGHRTGSPPDYPTLYPTKPFYCDEARVKNFIIYLKCMRHLVVKYKTCPGQSLYVRAVYILCARL